MTENPDWADGDFSFYTDKPTSIWGGKTYINPKNPEYIPNTPQNTIKKINTDVTPNYFKKLGNSYAQNENIGFGTTYFFDKGFIGLSADKKKVNMVYQDFHYKINLLLILMKHYRLV
ncbi:hypothetical protein OCUAc20_30100 [Acinetobacter baumannii]|nr:hypothetical protein OCUAc20_30100 [Acinetobacter baumannii]